MSTTANSPAAEAPDRLDSLAIIVREGAYDRVLTPLAFAYLAAAFPTSRWTFSSSTGPYAS